jgi:hypothetical protein
MAIYEIKGDSMKVCYELNGKDRPTEFKAMPKTQIFLVESRREKP